MPFQTLIVFSLCFCVVFNTPIQNSVENEIDYEWLGGGFEGDMIFPDGFDPTIESTGRGVAIYGPRRWSQNVVPYDMSAITNAGHRKMIESAMAALVDVTGTPIPGQTTRIPCITFRPALPNEVNVLKIQYGTGCSATVGFSFASKTMSLANPGCFHSGIIQHELIHVLGFYHEQSRPDRDDYVTINRANIQSGQEHNFNKYKWGNTVYDQKTGYDFNSIMHYGSNFFSSNGKPTITPIVPGARIGQRDHLSPTDIAEIRSFYGCAN
jgi:astacin